MVITITFYDLFAGIGGFHLGLENTGYYKCIGSCEIDKYASQIYRKYFGEQYPTEKDARLLDARRLPDFDMLTAGFPCQSFSVAGNEKGFDDDRGNLFFEIVKIAKEKKPHILLLENVKGLLSNDSGKTFMRILYELDAIGYDIQWQVINGKYFVPQQRERIFIIANLRDKPIKQIFPIKPTDQLVVGEIERKQEKQVITNCIDSNYWKGPDKHGQKTMIFTAHTKGNIQNRIQKRNETWTLDTSGTKQLLIEPDSKIRKLTPLECERLMGFPDNYTEGVSDTQRYKMLGNSVIVPLVEMLGQLIYKSIH